MNIREQKEIRSNTLRHSIALLIVGSSILALVLWSLNEDDHVQQIINNAPALDTIVDRCRNFKLVNEYLEALVNLDRVDEALAATGKMHNLDNRARAICQIVTNLVANDRLGQAQTLIDMQAVDTDSGEVGRSRSLALANISHKLAQLGFAQKARHRLLEAFDIASRIRTKDKDRTRTLSTLGRTLVEAEKIPSAVHVVKEIWTTWGQGQYSCQESLNKIAVRLAKEKEFDFSLIAARQIVRLDYLRSRTFTAIAIELAELGDFEQALAVAIEADSVKFSSALGTLAMRFAKAGRIKLALEAAQTINATDSRERALTSVSLQIARDGDVNKAVEIARGITDSWQRHQALRGLVEHLATEGWSQYARSLLDDALATARRIESSERSSRALAVTSGLLSDAGEIEMARNVIDEAIAAARQTTSPLSRANALASIAVTLPAVDPPFAVGFAVREMRIATDEFGSLPNTVRIFRQVSLKMAELGNVNQARMAADLALTAARRIDSRRGRGASRRNATSSLAMELSGAGISTPLLDKALESCDTLDYSRHLAGVAVEQANGGKIQDAITTANRIAEKTNRELAIANIAVQMAILGDISGSHKLVNKSGISVIPALCYIGGQLALQGDTLLATELFEAAMIAAREDSSSLWSFSSFRNIAQDAAKAGLDLFAQNAIETALAMAREAESSFGISDVIVAYVRIELSSVRLTFCSAFPKCLNICSLSHDE